MTEAAYHRIWPSFWDQPWSDDGKLFGAYLLTCRHRTAEGLFSLPLAYAVEDLGEDRWPLDRVRNALNELVADGFCEYDRQAKVVFIVNALARQQPANPNAVKAAMKHLAGLPATPLLVRFAEQALRHSERLSESLFSRYGELLKDRYSELLSEPLLQRIADPPAPTPSPTPPPTPGRDGGRRATYRGRQQPAAITALAVAVLDDFNQQAGTRYRAWTNADKPTEDLKRILGALIDADPPIDADEASRMIRARLAKPYWDGRPHPGVVFGPGAVSSSRENARQAAPRPSIADRLAAAQNGNGAG